VGLMQIYGNTCITVDETAVMLQSHQTHLEVLRLYELVPAASMPKLADLPAMLYHCAAHPQHIRIVAQMCKPKGGPHNVAEAHWHA
jgi:hypothetical protein